MQGEISVCRMKGLAAEQAVDVVAIEEPLEIRVNGESLAVTMRTPGHDVELVAGLLFTEGLIRTAADLLVIKHDADLGNADRENSVLAAIRPWDADAPPSERTFLSSSSCGVCGKKDLASVRRFAPPIRDDGPNLDPATVYALPPRMREAQSQFERTGGLHAAALFDPTGRLILLREDIGRHNAVDKVIGAELMAGRTPLSSRVLVISGRASFEILQKAAAARIPILCAVSAPSSLAVQMARDLNITLIGFLRGETMNIYSGADRVRAAAP